MPVKTLFPDQKPPWIGKARPLKPDGANWIAQQIGCPVAHVLAVLEVEAAGRWFNPDFSLVRRYEPHKFDADWGDWRKSLALSSDRREAMFLEAYERDPEGALGACSWGGPQIMGHHFEALGYARPSDMVREFADSAEAQAAGLVAFIIWAGLGPALRSGDFHAFAYGYNGPGKATKYGEKLRKAVARHQGQSPFKVLSLGDRGHSVRTLQEQIGVDADGVFGAETRDAVARFQEREGLAVDGIAGRETWAALDRRSLKGLGADESLRQSAPAELHKWFSAIGAGASAMGGIAASAPQWALHAVWAAVLVMVVYGGIAAIRKGTSQ